MKDNSNENTLINFNIDSFGACNFKGDLFFQGLNNYRTPYYINKSSVNGPTEKSKHLATIFGLPYIVGVAIP